MTVMEAIEKRRSVRAYQDVPLTDGQLTAVLEAFRLAPSWKDMQCWRVVVLRDRERIRKLGELLRYNPGRAVFDTVPCFLAVAADPEQSGQWNGKEYYMTDVGIALEHAVLAAAEQGLGTCWIGWFKEEPIKEFLGIPENMRLVALSPLGVPAEDPAPRPRKAPEEIFFGESWGEPLQ